MKENEDILAQMDDQYQEGGAEVHKLTQQRKQLAPEHASLGSRNHRILFFSLPKRQ